MKIKLFFASVLALVSTFAMAVVENIAGRSEQYMQRHGLQLGFVTLLKSYAGYNSGAVVSLPKSTEDALVAAGQATTSVGPVTAGAVTTTMSEGMVGISIGTSSVVVTNASVNVGSRIFAQISQASADGTALYVARVVPSAGFFTIYMNANAAAVTQVNWCLVSMGSLSAPT